MNKTRKRAMRYNLLYEEIELLNREDERRCYYCGAPAAAIDHQPPISKIEDLITAGEIFEAVKVPTCTECNNLLSSTPTHSLSERFELLKTKLRKKYKKDIHVSAIWDKEAIDELGDNLRGMVLASMRLGIEAEERILYRGPPVYTKENHIDSDFVEYCSLCNTYFVQKTCPNCGGTPEQKL